MEVTNEQLMEKIERIEMVLAQMNRERFSEQMMEMDELCKYLKISRKTVHTWRRKKILIAVKMGRRIYFRNKDIALLLETEFQKQNHKLLDEIAKKNKHGNGWDLQGYGQDDD